METKILIIDDNEDDRFFFKKHLADSGLQAQVTEAPDGITGCMEVSQNAFNCIFLDFNLPKMNGLEVLKKMRSMGVDTPIIMFTGQKDDQIIIQVLKEGANDYITKSFLTCETLRLCIENAQQTYRIRKEKEKAEAALKQSELRLSEAQHIARIGNWEYDTDTKQLYLSSEAQAILEYPHEWSLFPLHDFIRHHVHPANANSLLTFMRNLKNDIASDITLRIKTYNNIYKYINLKKRVSEDASLLSENIMGTIQDITTLKKALEETRKAKISRKATTLVLIIGVCIFLISEAIIDPFVDALQMGLIIALSFKGSIALFLKPLETFIERIMLKSVAA